jgi:hypothetical protein
MLLISNRHNPTITSLYFKMGNAEAEKFSAGMERAKRY